MVRYTAYIRTSRKSQINGLEAQKDIIDRFIDQYGGEIINLYSEQESGRKDNRVELAKALDECKKKKSILLVAKLDRVSRRVSFIAKLMESSIDLKVAEMPNADTFQLHIYSALAAAEANMISVRTKQALAVKKAQGVVLGRGDKLEVAKAARNYANSMMPTINDIKDIGIKSYNGIAKELNTRGILSRNGNNWSAAQVKRLIGYSDLVSV